MPKIMLNSVEYTGGVGDSGMELTYDEYLALPEEEKNNGTTYYVNDINGVGKDQFQPVIYSEEEREIGVWTDGKPLYEKTFNATSGSINNYNELDLGISSDSISMIKIKSCFIRNTFSGFDAVYHLGPYTTPADQQFLGGLNPKSNGNCVLFYRVGPYCAGGDLTLTVQYTKAVDTAGSGTWAPQGVPAVHYDGNEKVVGSWFGETLYEKSYYVQGVKDSAITVDSSITGATVKLIEVKQTFFTTGGAYVNVWGNNSISSTMFLRTLLSTGGLGVNFDGYRTDYYGNDGFDVYLTIRYTKTAS